MLVDVVPLRRQGERISNDEAKAARPTRGRLVLATRRAIDQFGTPVRVAGATFEPLPGNEPLHALDHAVVSTIHGDSIVVNGIEIWTAEQSSTFECPQTWWCRLVVTSAATP
jgi:hypothetical protein